MSSRMTASKGPRTTFNSMPAGSGWSFVACSVLAAAGGISPLIRASSCQGTLYCWAIFSIVSPGLVK